MSKQDVRDEFREMEGSPQVKARIRGLRRQMRRRQMKADVSRASVVVINPTHYAVALSFDFETMDPPRVLAKGRDLLAAQIREEARALSEQLAETNRRLQTAQSEILRSKMMTSVGEMAAGAAHEMNNPLAVISGRSQLLASQLTDAKHKAMAHLIHEQSHRLSEIITELMDFAKPIPPKFEECEPAELIARAMHDAKQHTDPADRTIEVTMGDVPSVVVDAIQVSAALTEVIDNAILATEPTSGHVAIHTAFDPYSSRVAITVSDNGCGMDEATLKRAFDPFFSSKPAGRRRGMGLPKALRWVESSGGSMRMESRPQQGTRTLILLPTAQATAGMTAAAVRKAAT